MDTMGYKSGIQKGYKKKTESKKRIAPLIYNLD